MLYILTAAMEGDVLSAGDGCVTSAPIIKTGFLNSCGLSMIIHVTSLYDWQWFILCVWSKVDH